MAYTTGQSAPLIAINNYTLLENNLAAATGPQITFTKASGPFSVAGSATAANAVLGVLEFVGDDEDNSIPSARIQALCVDATVASSGIVTSSLTFSTFLTSIQPRMVIAKTGAVTINLPEAAGVGLTIAGGGLTSTGTSLLTGALTQLTGAVTINDDAAGATLKFGTGAAAKLVTIGSNNGASALTMYCGTGNFALDGAAASTYAIGASTTTGTISIGGTAQTGTMTLAGGTAAQQIDIAASTGGKTVHIADGAGVNLVTIGSTVGASAVTIQSGTGDLSLTSTDAITQGAGGAFTLDAVGVLELNSSGAAIGIGNDAVAQGINIGTGAAARPIVAGNVTAGTTMVLNTPVGTQVSAPNGLIASVGNITATAGNLTTTTGNVVIAGVAKGVLVAPTTTGAGATPRTCNARHGMVTFTTAGIAAGANDTFVINNNLALNAAQVVMVSVYGATTGSALSIESVTVAAGTITVIVTNGTGATAQAANVTFVYWLLD